LCHIISFLVGVILTVGTIWFFRGRLFKRNSLKKEEKGPRCPRFVWFLLFSLSLDYFFAYRAKKMIDANYPDETIRKKAKTKYINAANLHNLILSFVLCVATFVVVYSAWGKCLKWGLFVFVGYRLLSRTVEINVAFFKDCLERVKNSDLDKYDRIKLAFKSLLEEAFLFAALYSFAKLEWWRALLGGAHSFILTLFSADFYYFRTFQFVAVYQVICTIILLTISFATYISTPDQPSGGKGNVDAKNGETGKTDKPGEISETDKPDEAE